MLDQEDCRWLWQWEELVDNGRVCYGGVEVTSVDEIIIISLMIVCKSFPECPQAAEAVPDPTGQDFGGIDTV